MTKIIITDGGEPLVEVKKYCPLVFVRQYEKSSKGRIENLKVRKTIAKMLNRAQSFLPEGIHLMVRDAWRPAVVQRQLFLNWKSRFRRFYPKWPEERIYSIASKYAIPPDNKIPSGHLTGGAVDVTLCYSAKRRLPMKTKRLTFKEQAATAGLNKLPANIAKNRQILHQAMTKAGFSNLPREWWHFSFGDYWWAKRTGARKTLYNKILN
jgi:D-alanyl-D-alanine dipeptidase